jgi:DNA-binding transcriptional MerR regulator
MAKMVETPTVETPFMTGSETSTFLHVPEETLRYWAWKGTGPLSVKVGRRRLYRRSDVEAWVEALERKQRGTGGSAA